MYLITSYEDAERYLGKKADKNRKIYNGMLKTYFLPVRGTEASAPGKRTEIIQMEEQCRMIFGVAPFDNKN